jgi:hypothetical protein
MLVGAVIASRFRLGVSVQDVGFLTEEWFWGAVAALAATIGAFFSWAIAAWIKRHEQPEADWAVTMRGYANEVPDPYGSGGAGFHVSGRISNVGDGAAFHVQLEGRNCDANLSYQDTQGMDAMPFMPSGGVLNFAIEIPLDKWEEAEVDIVWTTPPTRLKKKKRSSLTPREFMEMPGVRDIDPKTGETFQRPLKSE